MLEAIQISTKAHLDSYLQRDIQTPYHLILKENLIDPRKLHFQENLKRLSLSYEINNIDTQLILDHQGIQFEMQQIVMNVQDLQLIPFSQLNNLTMIGLKFNGDNPLTQGKTKLLGYLIQDLLHLHKFSLIIQQFNELGMNGLEEIFQGLSHLTKLPELVLQIGYYFCIISPNNIGPQGTKYIANAINKLENLENLDLFISSGNYILSEGAIALSNAIQQLQKLTVLSIIIGYNNNILSYQNDIQASGIIAITNAITYLPFLIELHLVIWCLNNMGKEGGLAAMENIGKLKQLQIFEVFLTYSMTMNLIFEKFPYFNDLVNLRSYKVILWPGTYDGPDGAISFGSSLGSCKSLEELYITVHSTSIGPLGARSIGEGISRLKHLKKLTVILRANEIDDNGFEGLNQGIRHLQNLQAIKIEIDHNNISQIKAFDFCETLAFLPQLDECSISIKDANFNAKELVNEISQKRKSSFQKVNEVLDRKTAHYAELIQFDLACTIALPK